MDLNEMIVPNVKSTYLMFKRKWNRFPKFIRLYLFVAILFVIFTFSYYILFVVSRKQIPDELIENNQHDNIEKNEDKPNEQINVHNPQQIIENNLIAPQKQLQQSIDYDNSPKIIATKKILPFLSDDNNGDSDNHDEAILDSDEFLMATKKQNEQQIAIQKAILHSWNGYRKYAWGQDMLKPITKKYHNWFNIGLTLLDSIDTLLIAGLREEFEEALDWIRKELSFDKNENVNCFETTIRALGGLLSAFHISKENILLKKAEDLGERLIHCFDSPSKTIPFSDVNLRSKIPKAPNYAPESSVSEVSSMQLEFRDLSYETNDKKYEEKSFETSKHLHELILKRQQYLVPMYINPYSGNFMSSVITLGARADSYYEYLYKQYLQAKIEFLLDDYIRSVDAIKNRLARTTMGKLKLLFIGELLQSDPQSIHPKMDHLVCFLSGTLTLGYYHEHLLSFHKTGIGNETFVEHLKLAEDLARTCFYMYNLTQTGLSPEIGYFNINDDSNDEYYIKPRDTHNLLRPEFVESLFFLYHITGKQIYRDWGWQIFQAFEKYTRINTGGYTTINDVRNAKNVKPKDLMESFWLAETLKYLYLLFMDDHKIVKKLLNNYVFNTEGHILPRRI